MGGGLEGRAPRVSAAPARGTYVSTSEGYRLVSAGTPSLLGGIYQKCRRRSLRFYARIGLFCALLAKNDRFYIRPPSCPPSSKIQYLVFSKRGSAKDQKTRRLSLQSLSSFFRSLGVEILSATYSVAAKCWSGVSFGGQLPFHDLQDPVYDIWLQTFGVATVLDPEIFYVLDVTLYRIGWFYWLFQK